MDSTISSGYYIHMGLNLTAALLLLIGSSIAIFRSQVGKSWYTYHRNAQLTAISIIVVAVLLGLWLRVFRPLPNAKDHWLHGTLGILLVILLLVQAWWAIIMNPRVEESTFLWVHRTLAVIIWGVLLYQVYLGISIVRETNPSRKESSL